MKWLEEPFSLDPQELAHNFATSSVLDRSKVFAIFVAIAVAVLLLPFSICLQVDGKFGDGAKWMGVLFPLWIWDAIILFYHSRVIMMGPISRPDHIPPEEWVDPLPMKKRIFSLFRFFLIVLFEVLAALKLDQVISLPWFVVFFPLYIWEATTIYKKFPLARMRIVTVEDLELALGKPFSQFTASEKELIGKRYSVVPSISSPEFEAAQKLKLRARHDLIKSCFRISFCLLLLIQLDGNLGWNWWLIFAPFWVMTALFCYSNYSAFAEVQSMAAEKDPATFGNKNDAANKASAYGVVGADGNASAAATTKPDITEEEREELKAQVMASSSRLCSKCCSQGFLLIMAFLFVAKIQGASYSALWIISPVLFVVSSSSKLQLRWKLQYLLTLPS
jgi:Transmembrane Fragile-X-F protein